MRKETGPGMSAFFTATSEPRPAPEQGLPSATVRTTITLTLEDADRLDFLRMHLRHDLGRSLTYGAVVGLALKCLAETEPIPKAFEPTQT
jgi:hypothetical protein